MTAPTTTTTDEALMAEVAGGSVSAFEALCLRHGPRLIATARRLLGDREQALEVVQDVWLALWNTRATYTQQAAFRGYLATLLYNRCRNAHRTRMRNRVQRGDDSFVEHASLVPSVEQVLVQVADEQGLMAALEQLEPSSREAIVLRYVEGLDYDAMGELTGVKPSTLRSRVFYALRGLKSFLLESSR